MKAYYADCLSLAGRVANDTASVFGNAIKAFKLLDELVLSSPDNIPVRLLRALQSYRLPENFFHRTSTAIMDFEYLAKRFEEDDTVFPEELYWKLLYLLGKCYQRLGMPEEREEAWEKLQRVSRDPVYAELIRQETKVDEGDGRLPLNLEKLSEKELFKEAKRLHALALEGDDQAGANALRILENLYEKHPEVPVIEGYYGSIAAWMGKNASEMQVLFGSAIRGIKLLNHAVENAPNHVMLRYLRGDLFMNLPEAFFHLTGIALEDFRFVVGAYEKNPDALPREKYLKALYNLGLCHRRQGNMLEAVTVWKKLVQCEDAAVYREKLKEWIKE